MTTPPGRDDAHPVDLLSARDIREIAASLDVRPSKQLGQNFVHDPNTVRLIVRRAEAGPDDHVLEIGPGLGSLTLALLGRARRVTAVELDRRLAGALAGTVTARDHGPNRLRVLAMDALDLTESDLLGPGDDSADLPEVLVANLPYNVATPILLTLLERLPSIDRGVVMVQKEVADRLAAGPGSKAYGSPSAKAAWSADVTGTGTVSRQVFWPVPNVDSALVRFARRDPPTADADRETVFAVIDAAFAQRRKTLRAALAGWAGSAPRAEQVLRAAGIEPSARGETLGIAEFARIAAADPVVPRSSRPDA